MCYARASNGLLDPVLTSRVSLDIDNRVQRGIRSCCLVGTESENAGDGRAFVDCLFYRRWRACTMSPNLDEQSAVEWATRAPAG